MCGCSPGAHDEVRFLNPKQNLTQHLPQFICEYLLTCLEAGSRKVETESA